MAPTPKQLQFIADLKNGIQINLNAARVNHADCPSDNHARDIFHLAAISAMAERIPEPKDGRQASDMIDALKGMSIKRIAALVPDGEQVYRQWVVSTVGETAGIEQVRTWADSMKVKA